MNDNIVSRDEFDEKLRLFYKARPGSNRTVWNRERMESVIKLLKEVSDPKIKRTVSHYHYMNNYELLEIKNKNHVIFKRKNSSDKLIYMLAIEDYYDKLLEAHIQSGHGGRDKMLCYSKKKWKICRSACEIFASCCKICDRKRSAPRRKTIVKPTIPDEFNIKGQVDLISFESCQDGEFKWLMNYQDQSTKFLHLRPLKSKDPVYVAEELSKIFFTLGAPYILQSDSGEEFVTCVINELASRWPYLKIVRGQSSDYSKGQGNIETINNHLEHMVKAWMIDHKSTNWSRGCYEVQVCFFFNQVNVEFNFMMLNLNF